jgi:hypothetical protein
MLKKA